MSNMGLSERLSAVDLFCGCGGISEGLRAAGFNVLAGIDVNEIALETFRNQFPEAETLNWDLASNSPTQLLDSLGLLAGELDLLAGGPPCQGFSKNVPRARRYLDDPKNQLVRTFLDYVEVLQPKVVMMENVAEMKNGFGRAYTEEVEERLSAAGYSVRYGVLLAADYGVPQMRRRAFFLAAKSRRVPEFPQPTHRAPSSFDRKQNRLFSQEVRTHVTVWEAIGDLPSLKHGEGVEETCYSSPPQNRYQELMRNGSTALTQHIARRLAPTQFERLKSLRAGEGYKQLPEHLRPKSGYSGAYGRLTKDMVAPTITRWMFHPGSGRFGHPVDVRTITIREAARLQSFPDRFAFSGSYNKQSEQLGNAVPPLLAQRIAEGLIEQYTLQTRLDAI